MNSHTDKRLRTEEGKQSLSFYGNPMLTDLYQITMAYAYWREQRHTESSVFELYFRKCPFKGEYCIFAGLSDVVDFVQSFSFGESDINFLKSILPGCDSGFFQYLLSLDCSDVQVYAQREGSVCFPSVPMIRVEGPLGICQLLETTLLNLVNFASLITTNAARHRQAMKTKTLLEFGLRRAQGPDGAMSASRYAVLGGYDGTSNVLAAKIFGLAVKGTHAHSFVTSYTCLDQIRNPYLTPKAGGTAINFLELTKQKLNEVSKVNGVSPDESELAAFIAYALAYPNGFLALIDTYDTLSSGIPNFLAVALSLHELGYRPIGVRLDSGDLSYLSLQSRDLFVEAAKKFKIPYFEKLIIVASNNIHEGVLHSLNEQGHAIDSFGIGTHLVTCKSQPALGCVYKLVEIQGKPRIKLSDSAEKVTIPGKKNAYRLYGKTGEAILDLMTVADEKVSPNDQILCRHPRYENQRVFVRPAKVKNLLEAVWLNGNVVGEQPSFAERKLLVQNEIASLRRDHVRHLNPTPYKVSVSEKLYEKFHSQWMAAVPIRELS